MKRTIVLLFLLISAWENDLLAFSSLRPPAGCDTLVLRDGQYLVVNILHVSERNVRYLNCGESESAVPHTIKRSQIWDFRPASPSLPDTLVVVEPGIPQGASIVDAKAEQRKAQRFMNQSILCTAGMLLLLFLALGLWQPFLIAVALILGTLALTFGVKGLRFTHDKEHLLLKRFGLWLSIIVASIIQLFTFAIALTSIIYSLFVE